MKNLLLNTLLTTTLAAALPVGAGTIPFYFSSPSGTLGVSQSFTTGGITLTARGYSGIYSPGVVGTPVDLFGKTAGSDETGLGIAAGADHEILNNYFIQIDFSDLKAKMLNPSAQIMIGSVQAGESYSIYGSNSMGIAGTMLINKATLDGQYFAVPSLNKYSFYSVAAPAGNVLLDAVSVNGPVGPSPVPEPGTLALFAGAALTSMAFSRRLRRAVCGANSR